MTRYRRLLVLTLWLGLISIPLTAKDLITSDIRYIQEEKIADLTLPPLEGEYYDDLVPPTLDIAERAALAINALTGNADPAADYEMYWDTSFDRNPPLMGHNWNDWCGTKFWEAMPLLRRISGSTLNSQVDPVWLDVMLRSIGPDGLFYIPMGGRPWARFDVQWGPGVWRADGTKTNIGDLSVMQITHPMPIGRVINTMMIYCRIDNNPAWKKIIEKMIDRSLEIMVDKGDYGFIPGGFFEPDAKVDPDAEVPKGTFGIESYARLIQAPANYYRLTGYEPARELARKMVNCVRYHGENFGPGGRFIDEGGGGEPLFHGNTCALLSMTDYALATDDKELFEFIKTGYQWARQFGNPTVGFFPEFADPGHPSSELCAVADMIAIALKLSNAGVCDYWDDADRWIRNQYSEAQLTRIDWIYARAAGRKRERLSEATVVDGEGREQPAPPGTCTADLVPERNLGAFAGFATPNDWAGNGYIMPCCTSNGARTIYYIWEHILGFENGRLKVNLLLNRASPWADVYSYIPYEGKVRLKIKQPCTEVLIRMPEWVAQNSPEVKCSVNAKARPFSWEGRYLKVEASNPGDIVDVAFPISEKTVQERIVNKDYTLVLRGNTVISIDPPGEKCPLYQREYYRNQMPWRPVRRFVTNQVFHY